MFQQSYVDPSLQALQRQIIPALKEGFLGLDESGSSSLNRALAQSASDVSAGLGHQRMNLFQQQQQNKISALSGLGGLAGQRTFEPQVEHSQGILGQLIAAAGQVGAGFAGGGPAGGILSAIMGLLGGQQGGQGDMTTGVLKERVRV